MAMRVGRSFVQSECVGSLVRGLRKFIDTEQNASLHVLFIIAHNIISGWCGEWGRKLAEKISFPPTIGSVVEAQPKPGKQLRLKHTY